jgi:hypothetical protein
MSVGRGGLLTEENELTADRSQGVALFGKLRNKKEEVLGKVEGRKNGARIASRADRLTNACRLIRFDKRGTGLPIVTRP